MDMCVDHLGDKDIHLSFDVDAMDPFYAPSTGTAVRYTERRAPLC
jgi:arginase